MNTENKQNYAIPLLDQVVRGLAVAGIVILPACGYHPRTFREAQNATAPTTTAATATSKENLPPPGSVAMSEVLAIQSKYNIMVMAENWDIEQELGILNSLIGKIPGAGFLNNRGIRIHKNIPSIRSSQFGIYPYFNETGAGMNIVLPNNFNPYDQPNFELQISRMFGKLLIERLNTNDQKHPIFTTFAQIAGWQYGKVEGVKTPVVSIDLDKGTSKVIETDFEGWYKKGADGEYSTNIGDAFAEYYAAWILQPQLLLDAIKGYFDRIGQGLKSNPQEFIDKIRINPDILLAE